MKFLSEDFLRGSCAGTGLTMFRSGEGDGGREGDRRIAVPRGSDSAGLNIRESRDHGSGPFATLVLITHQSKSK